MTTKVRETTAGHASGDGRSQASRDDNQPKASVRYSFRKIGPVKSAHLVLGDLTVIAGRNNTGKTYLAYTLYGFLKMWRGWPRLRRFRQPSAGKRKSKISIPDMSEVAEQLHRESHTTLCASPGTMECQRREILEQLSADFSKRVISQVFSSQSGSLENASINVQILDGDKTDTAPENVEIRLPGNGSVKLKAENSQVFITFDPPNTRRGTLHLEHIVASGYLSLLLGRLFPEPFIFSAERFGISLFYRELDFTKNRLVDLLQKMGDDKNRDKYSPFLLIDQATSRYALPIKDNIDYTRSLPDRAKDKSEFYTDKPFNHIKDMMHGYFSASGDDIRFISKARGQDRSFNIPLHLASSSARGLSDLYFFLRHVAKNNHLLIIDEPESHLDTANQIQLARLLARLVRMGLKVLITTHSDYLIKEINNLIMLDSNFERKDEVVGKLGYTAEDALSQDSVRAYVAKNNGLTPCKIDRFGIDMPLFDETIDNINKSANELASRLEQQGE